MAFQVGIFDFRRPSFSGVSGFFGIFRGRIISGRARGISERALVYYRNWGKYFRGGPVAFQGGILSFQTAVMFGIFQDFSGRIISGRDSWFLDS